MTDQIDGLSRRIILAAHISEKKYRHKISGNYFWIQIRIPITQYGVNGLMTASRLTRTTIKSTRPTGGKTN